MHIQTFYFNPFRECTYLLSDDKGYTIIIDCGAYTTTEQYRLQEYIEKRQLTIAAHLLTHAHLDHCFGAKFIYEAYNVLPQLSSADDCLFSNLQQQSIAFGCPLEDTPIARYIPLDSSVQIGDFQIEVLPTPGHTPGGASFYIKPNPSNNQPPILFSGDTLFQCGIGRTDLPGGNYATLLRSLREQIMPLPDETIVYPGHGYSTTIGEEKQSNPYL